MTLPRQTDDPHDPEWEITASDTARRHADGEIILLDCRTVEEREIAAIDGCLFIPMNDLGARLDELREHDAASLVVFCHHGRRSLRVAAALRENGFDEVLSMAGGINRWSEVVDPSVPRY